MDDKSDKYIYEALKAIADGYTYRIDHVAGSRYIVVQNPDDDNPLKGADPCLVIEIR